MNSPRAPSLGLLDVSRNGITGEGAGKLVTAALNAPVVGCWLSSRHRRGGRGRGGGGGGVQELNLLGNMLGEEGAAVVAAAFAAAA